MSANVIRGFVLVIFAVVTLAAQQTLEQAWNLAAGGRQQEAVRLLDDLVRREPGNADVRLLLGSLLMEAGESGRAIDHLKSAVRLRPKSAEAENALGEAYARAGDATGAQDAFQKAVLLDSRFGIAQLNLGQALLAGGDAGLALTHLKPALEALGRTDDAAKAHYLIAKAYTANGNVPEAASHLQRAVEISPGFAEAWSELGQARKNQLDGRGARAAFEMSVRLNPEDPIAQYRLGAECLRQDDVTAAIEHLRKADQLKPADQSTLNSLQMALRRAGRQDEANLVKQKLADLLKERDRVSHDQLMAIRLNNEGAELEASKDLRSALAKYREAAGLYPEMAGIRVNYAVALLRLGRWTEGLEELHQASLKDPGNTKIAAALQDALSQAPENLKPAWSRRSN